MKGKLLENYSREKEVEVKKLWADKSIAEKVRRQSAKQKETFYFMDGPPYASGHIHMGTALNKTLKDVAIRYNRMKGLNVFDRPGYDTHGLPIEHAVEKELGLNSKEDIEKFGVENFVEKCREFATQYIGTMNSEFQELGVWMDWENPYVSLSPEYIEGIWYSFKKAHEKGLLYLGSYPGHGCPRCETTVSFNEITFANITHESFFMKYQAMEDSKKFYLVWSTVPWSHFAETCVIGNPEFDYVEYQPEGIDEQWIFAKARLQYVEKSLKVKGIIVREFKGKELKGKKYLNPFESIIDYRGREKEFKEKCYIIVLDTDTRFINLEMGTGLNPISPSQGKEDWMVGKKFGLPTDFHIIDEKGSLNHIGELSGIIAWKDDKKIMEWMKKHNSLAGTAPFTHSYPLCWRCKSQLIMLSLPQWFFKISELQPKLLKANQALNWVPEWGKIRFEDWLNNLEDWPISRNRYWGTPLPIWECSGCDDKKVIGSMKELQEKAGLKKAVEPHKPWIDEVTWKCKCGGTRTRVSGVLDVWFDSGVSSWAALGYPQDEKKFKQYWPADLNIEGSDQIRGWWNSQMITSFICFDKPPFKTIVMHGMVLDLEKKKMSKSLGNIVSPNDVIEKYNIDYLRHYLTSVSKGENFSFSWDAFRDIHKFYTIYANTFNFVNLYLGFEAEHAFTEKEVKNMQPEDQWIISRFNSLMQKTEKAFDEYKLTKAIQLMTAFVLEDFSRTYVKLVKDRLGTKEEKTVQHILSYMLLNTTKLLAPITPHVTEYFYQAIKQKGMEESIHLTALPKVQENLIYPELEEEMNAVKEIIQDALHLREQAKLRLRWPLEELVLTGNVPVKTLQAFLAKAVNVKKVSIAKEEPKGEHLTEEKEGYAMHLVTDADAALQEEWELHELTRKIQSLRKEKKLNPQDKVTLYMSSSNPEFITKFKKHIEEATNTDIQEKKGAMEKLLNNEFFIEVVK